MAIFTKLRPVIPDHLVALPAKQKMGLPAKTDDGSFGP
jgi:hypothetical protein